MSDLFETREKTEKGAEWRGEINVEVDGDVQELTVRQLVDPEFWEVMSKIDMDELDELDADLPEDTMEEYRELQEKSELTEEDEERLNELTEEIDSDELDMFETLSWETYDGIRTAAEYGVEPDGEDLRHALRSFPDEIRDKYGGTSEEDARQYINDHVIPEMLADSVDFTSFAIGIRVLSATLDEKGN